MASIDKPVNKVEPNEIDLVRQPASPDVATLMNYFGTFKIQMRLLDKEALSALGVENDGTEFAIECMWRDRTALMMAVYDQQKNNWFYDGIVIFPNNEYIRHIERKPWTEKVGRSFLFWVRKPKPPNAKAA